jgi:phosphotransferase system IIB component
VLSPDQLKKLPTAAQALERAPEEMVPEASEKELDRIRSCLGGKANILSSQPIAKTRLAIKLEDFSKTDSESAEDHGFALFRPQEGEEIHLIVGPHPERFVNLA